MSNEMRRGFYPKLIEGQPIIAIRTYAEDGLKDDESTDKNYPLMDIVVDGTSIKVLVDSHLKDKNSKTLEIVTTIGDYTVNGLFISNEEGIAISLSEVLINNGDQNLSLFIQRNSKNPSVFDNFYEIVFEYEQTSNCWEMYVTNPGY